MQDRILRVLGHDFAVVVKRHIPASDRGLIQFAYEMACYAHNGQALRHSGESYITHPVNVGKTMIGLGLRDPEYICRGLLHDVFEDCAFLTREDVARIRERLGSELVDDIHTMTKRYASAVVGPTERPPEFDYYQVLRHAPRRVQITKMFDRFDNLRDLHGQHISAGKRERVKDTTRTHFVPMARDMLDSMNRTDDLRHIVEFLHNEFVRLCRG